MVSIEEFTAENIDLTDPYGHLALLSREQLMAQCLRYRKYIERLEQWQLDAFEVSPNIDLDIERIRAIRYREKLDKLRCEGCNSVGMWHCSDPENCGNMK